MKIPRILISAFSSGSGKTLFVCGLIEALKKKGVLLQSFKCGPDYIDPMFHEHILGKKSINLDPWFSDGKALNALLYSYGKNAEISIIEGVMGYYDGLGGNTTDASTYTAASLTNTPVVIIVNTKGIATSIIPLIKGFLEFRSDHHIKGIILNQTSAGMFPLYRDMIEKECKDYRIKVLGYIPWMEEVQFESRHLGLILPNEIPKIRQKLDLLSEKLLTTIDYESLIRIANDAAEIEMEDKADSKISVENEIVIGIAKDEAFSFLYHENMELLKKYGAKFIYFSPIHDTKLPDKISGLILPGGYPELYAKELSLNNDMKNQIKQLLEDGMPCLAECGGFQYLQEMLEDDQHEQYEMVGFFKGGSYPKNKLVRFGYISVEAKEDTPYIKKGEWIKGHEFHYWDSDINGEICLAKKASGTKSWSCMQYKKAVLAGYPHLYYASLKEFGARFVNACILYKKESEK